MLSVIATAFRFQFMRKITPPCRFLFVAGRRNCFRTAVLAAGWVAIAVLFLCGRANGKNADFLIESWQDHEGVPESAALAVAQSPDGFLWVGSPEGLLRFNGVSFSKAEKFTDLIRLTEPVTFLHTDRAGRLWAGANGRLAFYERGVWQKIGGTNIAVRSVATAGNGRF